MDLELIEETPEKLAFRVSYSDLSFWFFSALLAMGLLLIGVVLGVGDLVSNQTVDCNRNGSGETICHFERTDLGVLHDRETVRLHEVRDVHLESPDDSAQLRFVFDEPPPLIIPLMGDEADARATHEKLDEFTADREQQQLRIERTPENTLEHRGWGLLMGLFGLAFFGWSINNIRPTKVEFCSAENVFRLKRTGMFHRQNIEYPLDDIADMKVDKMMARGVIPAYRHVVVMKDGEELALSKGMDVGRGSYEETNDKIRRFIHLRTTNDMLS